MAKVYEAMLLSQNTAPEATRQFLNDYNFSEVISDPNPAIPEDDPLDLAALGLLPYEPQLASDSVGTNVAVAEAIAQSVSNFATSVQESTFQPIALTPALVPSVAMPVVPESRDLVPALYRAEFRQLGEIVMRTAAQRRLNVVVVCGVDPTDQADFVLENLSLALAENPDLRVARFSLLSPSNAGGEAGSSFQIKIHRTGIANLCEVAPLNGALPIGQLLHECDIVKMMEMLKHRFDFVLIETDAVNWADEVATFAGKADGVILVAQKENMRGPAMNTARQKLHEAGAQVLGAVVNRNRESEQLQRVA